MVVETYASCFDLQTAPVIALVPENSRKIPPTRSTGDPVTVFRLVAIGRMS